jgi:hypothetical protein
MAREMEFYANLFVSIYVNILRLAGLRTNMLTGEEMA